MAPGLARRQARATKNKVPERPHWITIGLGFVSALGTVTALYLTTRSLETSQKALETSQTSLSLSERSMKTGQRAYLSIDKWKTASGIRDKTLGYDLTFAVINNGNTPGQINEIKLEFETPLPIARLRGSPPRGEPDQLGFVITIPKSEAIRAHGEALFNEKGWFDFSEEHWKLYEQRGRMVLFVRVTVNYSDVFDDKHHAEWCWVDSAVTPPQLVQPQSGACGPSFPPKFL